MLKEKTTIVTIFFAFLFCFVFFSYAQAETLKIGFVTDWEYGTQSYYSHKLPKKAEQYLKSAVNHYNNILQPDLVVGGGDYILSRGVKKKKAAKQLRHINNVFSKANAPRLYCIGNHDLAKLSKGEVQQNLGINYTHSSVDINGVRVITLDTNSLASSKKSYGVTGRLPDGELEWLEEKLDTSFPVIVFSHHSPIQTKGKTWRANIYNAVKLRNVLEKYGNVVAVFSGHHAVNYQTKINDINYLIINNLTDKKARGSYADITVEKKGNEVAVFISQYGKKPAAYNFSKILATD